MNGDTCKIASCIAVDSTTIACAPLKIGDQATLGASSVLLPGTTLGTQSTLAPLAAPAIGSVVEAKSINLGAPAVPVKVPLLLACLNSHAEKRTFLWVPVSPCGALA